MKCERWKFKAINAESCPFCGSNSVSVAHKEVRHIGQNAFGVKKIKNESLLCVQQVPFKGQASILCRVFKRSGL